MTWMRSRRTYLVFGCLAILAILALWWIRRSPAVSTATQQSIVTVGTSTLSQSVSASGTINPKVQSAVRFTSPGAVTAVNVKVGDAVVAGQPLATIDPTDLQNALDLAQANANSAAASLSSAKASGTATATTLAAANSQVAAANARLATARTALASATLTSPIDGTVAAVNVTVGDQVSGGGTTSGSGSSGNSGNSGNAAGGGAAGGNAATASNAQVVVISTGAWTVATSVSSADLASIKPGLQAQITPTGARQPVFGTVSTVGVIATTSNGVASFPVTIAVTGSPPGLYAGATATVAIIVREVTDALTVPTGAIRTAAGQTTVVKVVDGQQVVVPVQLGMVQGALTQVTAGVAEGDQVVVESATGFGTGGGSGSTGTRTRGTGSGAGQGSGVPGGGAPAGGAPGAGAPAGAPGGGQ